MAKTTNEDATLARIRELIDSCFICHGSLSGHSYTLMAMAVFDPTKDRSAYALLQDLQNHDWDKVVSYHDWDGSSDDLLLFAVRCSSERYFVMAVEDPYLPGANDRILYYEVLDAENTDQLCRKITAEAWRGIP